jgi:hypothetical protein
MFQTWIFAKGEPSVQISVPTPTAVEELQGLKRQDLLEVFRASYVPDNLSDIEGEWNGVILENNGLVMSSVTRFLTNGLFGRGRKWNGKAFFQQGKGVNRFLSKNKHKSGIDQEHSFDYGIQPSALISEETSVMLVYNKYQSPASLWYTMKDEIRLIPHANGQILVGLGCMAWSGGMLNGSPFCLWRSSSD